MAAKQLQDDEDNLGYNLWDCPVCLDQIKQPKMLRCQHSFCLDPCLQNMVEYGNGRKKIKKKIKCAICRKSYDVASLDTIPDNLQMKNLLEVRQKSVNDGMYFCQVFDYLWYYSSFMVPFLFTFFCFFKCRNMNK